MTAAKRQLQCGTKVLSVMALQDADGWLYLAEIVDPQDDGEIRIRAVNYTPFATAAKALATGLAYARWIATDATQGYDPAAEVAMEIRPH